MEPTSPVDLEAWAKQQMPHDLWDFVAGGSADEITPWLWVRAPTS